MNICRMAFSCKHGSFKRGDTAPDEVVIEYPAYFIAIETKPEPVAIETKPAPKRKRKPKKVAE